MAMCYQALTTGGSCTSGGEREPTLLCFRIRVNIYRENRPGCQHERNSRPRRIIDVHPGSTPSDVPPSFLPNFPHPIPVRSKSKRGLLRADEVHILVRSDGRISARTLPGVDDARDHLNAARCQKTWPRRRPKVADTPFSVNRYDQHEFSGLQQTA